MNAPQHQSPDALDAALVTIRQAPVEAGPVVLLVRRPATGERELISRARLSVRDGMVGDNWSQRASRHSEDGGPDPERQLTLMGSRAIAAITGDDVPEHWALAGDQVFVDLDLDQARLPVGAQLQLGGAVVEITAPPHTGCKKFTERFGSAATRWCNSREGRALRLRGVNARVVRDGDVAVGDTVAPRVL